MSEPKVIGALRLGAQYIREYNSRGPAVDLPASVLLDSLAEALAATRIEGHGGPIDALAWAWEYFDDEAHSWRRSADGRASEGLEVLRADAEREADDYHAVGAALRRLASLLTTEED